MDKFKPEIIVRTKKVNKLPNNKGITIKAEVAKKHLDDFEKLGTSKEEFIEFYKKTCNESTDTESNAMNMWGASTDFFTNEMPCFDTFYKVWVEFTIKQLEKKICEHHESRTKPKGLWHS